MSKVYLAMYKARGNWVDKIIRLFTGKPYSHCELAVANGDKYLCYSSSPRDGGVRYKAMHLSEDKWDLIPITGVSVAQITQFYGKTAGKKYDFVGAIGCALPLRQKPSRYYCSEWCYEAVFGQAPKTAISPNQLAQIAQKRTQ